MVKCSTYNLVQLGAIGISDKTILRIVDLFRKKFEH